MRALPEMAAWVEACCPRLGGMLCSVLAGLWQECWVSFQMHAWREMLVNRLESGTLDKGLGIYVSWRKTRMFKLRRKLSGNPDTHPSW